MDVGEEPSRADSVVAIYREALPQVYGYLVLRCGSVALAEDLTAETFLAAVGAAGKANAPDVSIAWLVGVARHKLVDHWRRVAREQRALAAVESADSGVDDPWDRHLDVQAVRGALSHLSGPQQVALSLRYLDGMPVAEVAEHIGRSVHATETLLVRARAALRRVYTEGEDRDV